MRPLLQDLTQQNFLCQCWVRAFTLGSHAHALKPLGALCIMSAVSATSDAFELLQVKRCQTAVS